MRSTDVLRRAGAVDAVDLDGDQLVYDGVLLTLLSRSSALIWQQVDGRRTVEEVVTELCRRHPDADQVRPDVLSFLDKMVADGLLEASPRPAGPRYTRPEHVGWVRDGSVCLLIHLARGVRRVLTPSGSRVWELVCEHGSLEPVLRGLREEYPDAPGSLAEEVAVLLAELEAEDLLVCYP